MGRSEDWQQDIRQAKRHEPFILAGTNRMVKVAALATMSTPVFARVSGYVTQEKFLCGKSPQQIEAALGLKGDSLKTGCRVYRFRRQPGPSECTYELTTAFPDGLAYHEGFSNPDYPPGDARIHQWRLCVEIPVDHLIDLLPGQRYPGNGAVG